MCVSLVVLSHLHYSKVSSSLFLEKKDRKLSVTMNSKRQVSQICKKSVNVGRTDGRTDTATKIPSTASVKLVITRKILKKSVNFLADGLLKRKCVTKLTKLVFGFLSGQFPLSLLSSFRFHQ